MARNLHNTGRSEHMEPLPDSLLTIYLEEVIQAKTFWEQNPDEPKSGAMQVLYQLIVSLLEDLREDLRA